MKSGKNKISQTVTIIAIAILALFAFGLKKCQQSKQDYPDRELGTEAGDWRHHKVIYTKHARCRMDCRDITEEEVEYILSEGKINEAKSNEYDDEAKGQCPTYALEGQTNDGQEVRIIFGACKKITKVITAIDLREEHECNCR